MSHAIRTASPMDAAALHLLAAATFPLACPPHTTPDAIAQFIATNLSEQRFEEYLADPARVILIADDFTGYTMTVFADPFEADPTDADVAAVVTARPVAELSKCYVLPAAHGSGLAAALVEASVEVARERGAVAVWLGVNQLNERANAFYAKRGFEQVGTKCFLVGDRYEEDFVRVRVL